MSATSAKILSAGTNVAVVLLPERKYPGSVIQGDSLKIMFGHAESIWERVRNSEDEELVESARALHDSLKERLKVYERTLQEHQIPVPYA